MNSRIYVGKVMHARNSPIHHRWTFPYCFYAIDLDELPELNQNLSGFGVNRWQPVSLREQDYLRGDGSFRDQLSEFIDTAGIDRIILVTAARFMIRVFNPVSFYYCLRKDGTPSCMVVEVNNTFGERHLYLLNGSDEFPLRCKQGKQFHVSPFNDMQGNYEFTFSAPDDELNIGIRLIRNGSSVIDTALWGTGRPLTSANLWKTLLRYPINSWLTMPRILWQAILLHYKNKLPVFKKPAPISNLTIKESK